MQLLSPLAINFLPLYQKLGNANSVDVVEIGIHLDSDILKSTLTILADRHASLVTKIKRIGPFFFKIKNPRPINLNIEEIDDLNKDHDKIREDLCQKAHEIKINPFSDPLIQFFYVKGSSGKSYLLIISTHLVSDAKSCLILLKDIQLIYNALKNQGEVPPAKSLTATPSLYHLTLKGKTLSFIVKSIFLMIFSLFKDLFKTNSKVEYKASRNFTEEGAFQVKFKELDKIDLANLLHHCKMEKITLHSLLTGSMAKTLGDVFNWKKNLQNLTLMDTYNFRDRTSIDVQHQYDLLMLSYPFNVKPHNYRDTASSIQKLKGELFYQEILRQYFYAFCCALLPMKFYPFLLSFMSKTLVKSNVIHTNWGIIDEVNLNLESFPISDYFVVSICFPPGRTAFIWSTFRKKLRISFVTDNHSLSKDQMDQFLVSLEDNLLNAPRYI